MRVGKSDRADLAVVTQRRSATGVGRWRSLAGRGVTRLPCPSIPQEPLPGCWAAGPQRRRPHCAIADAAFAGPTSEIWRSRVNRLMRSALWSRRSPRTRRRLGSRAPCIGTAQDQVYLDRKPRLNFAASAPYLDRESKLPGRETAAPTDRLRQTGRRRPLGGARVTVQREPSSAGGRPPAIHDARCEPVTKWVTARFRNEIAELPSNLVPRFVHRKPAESLRNRN